MSRAELTTFFDSLEMRRSGAPRDFLRPSLDADLSRPPEPGSFRFSLEEMRRNKTDFAPSPASPRFERAPAEGRRDGGAVSRRPDPPSPQRKVSPRRSGGDEEDAAQPQRAAAHGQEAASGAGGQRPEQAQQNRKPAETHDSESQPADDVPRDDGTVAENPDGTRQSVAVAAGAGSPATGKMAAEENPPPTPTGQGAEPPAGDDETPRVVSDKAAAGAAGEAKKHLPTGGTAAEAGRPAKSSAPGDSKKAGSETAQVGTPARFAGKPQAAPAAASSVEVDSPAAPVARAAVSGKGGAPSAAQLQVQPQAAPAAVPTETAAPQGQGHSAAAAAPEISAPGRVARIGADSQSGQTGLFQGHHAASGHVQASGGVTAPEAPAQPFHQDLMQQVAEKTVFHLRNGRAEARIDLKPESLGHLKLHVSTDHGQVTLKILTESTWVRDMIESHISHLKNELQQHNLQIDRLDVSVSGGQQETGDGNARASASPRNPAGDADTGGGGSPATVEETEVPRSTVQWSRVGLVDYFA